MTPRAASVNLAPRTPVGRGGPPAASHPSKSFDGACRPSGVRAGPPWRMVIA